MVVLGGGGRFLMSEVPLKEELCCCANVGLASALCVHVVKSWIGEEQ